MFKHVYCKATKRAFFFTCCPQLPLQCKLYANFGRNLYAIFKETSANSTKLDFAKSKLFFPNLQVNNQVSQKK